MWTCHMKKPVASDVKTLGKEEVLVVLRVDMGDPPTIAENFDPFSQACDLDRVGLDRADFEPTMAGQW